VAKALILTGWEEESLLQIKLSIAAWWDHFFQQPGDTPVTRKVNKHHLRILDTSPQKCCRIFKGRETGHHSCSAGSSVLLCWHKLSGLMSKG
jgi:hypothetical protein